jgi:hypothetical protein
MVNDAELEAGEFDPAEETEEERRARLMLPPKERVRLKPKLGLASMVYFIMDVRLRGETADGRDAGETWVRLTPEDLESLEDVADTLEWFRLQRLLAKVNPGRGRR